MNTKFLKPSLLSLLSVLSFMSAAHAGKIEISNLDMPDNINGIPMRARVTFMGKTSGYQHIDVDLAPAQRGISFSHEVPNDSFSELMLSYAAASSADMYNIKFLSCRINMGENSADINDKQILNIVEESLIAICVSYQPDENKVTGDIVSPY
jgi:hypothetical protein